MPAKAGIHAVPQRQAWRNPRRRAFPMVEKHLLTVVLAPHNEPQIPSCVLEQNMNKIDVVVRAGFAINAPATR
jgi:hypothetical protein